MLNLSRLNSSLSFRPRLGKKKAWIRISRLVFALASLCFVFFIANLAFNRQQTELLLSGLQELYEKKVDDTPEQQQLDNGQTLVTETSDKEVVGQEIVVTPKKTNFRVQFVAYDAIRIAQLTRKQKQLEALTITPTSIVANASSSDSKETQDYISRIEQRIIKKGTQRYQRLLSKQNLIGEAEIGIDIAPSGSISQLKLLTSSGNTRLDQELLVSIREAAPFPPVPEELYSFSTNLSFVRWLSFSSEGR